VPIPAVKMAPAPEVKPEQAVQPPVDFVAPDATPSTEPAATTETAPIPAVPIPAVPRPRLGRGGKAAAVLVPEAAVPPMGGVVPAEAEPAQPDDLAAAMDEAPEPVKRKRRWSTILLLLLSVLLVIGGLSYLGYTWYKNTHEITYTDLDGNKVVPDDNSAKDPAWIQKAEAKEEVAGLRFKIPSVNLNVPLGEVNQVDGLINPPGFKSVYRVKNMGVTLDQAAKGTVYAVTHSLRAPGKAPGNYVIDIDTASIIVQNDAEIDVGDVKYTVVSSFIVNKNDLAAQANLWANTPGMLVFITCLQFKSSAGYVDGHSPDNVVIIGQLAT